MSDVTDDDERDATNDMDDAEPSREVEVDAEASVEAATPYEDVPFRVMHLESVLYDLTDPSPMVHLLEAESPFRYLVIPVALPDAIAIQHAHSAIEGRRPSTHELFYSVLAGLGTEVIAARIVRYEDGVFYAELDLMTPKGRRVFDCRTSDAISMALRQKTAAPILCSEEVLQHYYS
ncbi:MAG TPA: bifunctional nuclease family protein [Acidimicrobiales bacterium]|nr:bifunctional nuclease family protein [Acidimicrobiales bacterium]